MVGRGGCARKVDVCEYLVRRCDAMHQEREGICIDTNSAEPSRTSQILWNVFVRLKNLL